MAATAQVSFCGVILCVVITDHHQLKTKPHTGVLRQQVSTSDERNTGDYRLPSVALQVHNPVQIAPYDANPPGDTTQDDAELLVVRRQRNFLNCH